MRQMISLSLLCCILLAFLVQAGSCTTATINVVKNPSFENGLNDWEWIKTCGDYGVSKPGDAPDGEYVGCINTHLCSHFRVFLCGEEILTISPNSTWRETSIDISSFRGKYCYLIFKSAVEGYENEKYVIVRQKLFIPLDAQTLIFYHKENYGYGSLCLDNIRILTTRDYEEIQDPSFEYEIGNNPDVCWSEWGEVNASSYSATVTTSTEYAKYGSKSLKLSASISDGNYVLAGVRQKIELTDVDYLKFWLYMPSDAVNEAYIGVAIDNVTVLSLIHISEPTRPY